MLVSTLTRQPALKSPRYIGARTTIYLDTKIRALKSYQTRTYSLKNLDKKCIKYGLPFSYASEFFSLC